MKLVGLGLALLAFAMPCASLANDTMATLGTGGLVFITNDDIAMASEDLSISPEQVKVVYEFDNKSDKDQHILVAFPLPDITGDGDFMVSIPTEDEKNIFGFKTTLNGKPVDAVLHQYAFSLGIDQTDYLKGLGIPLTPYGTDTQDKINALPDSDKQELIHRGMVIAMDYDAGQGPQTDYTPIWTLRSTYSWEGDFPAGKSEVVHTYAPSVGGTTGVTFLTDAYDGYDPAREYKEKYCTDDDFINAVKKTGKKETDDYISYPFTQSWISYIWSTGANWNGAIGKFHLTVDKGSPNNLISFCGDNIKKTGPTTFEMTATDFSPPYDHELEILILNRWDD